MDTLANNPDRRQGSQDGLNQSLAARLMRPLYRPGVIAAEPGRRIMARIQRRDVPPPLLDQLSQRQQPLADMAIQRQPIVFAQAIRAPEPAEEPSSLANVPALSPGRRPASPAESAGAVPGATPAALPVVTARLLQRTPAMPGTHPAAQPEQSLQSPGTGQPLQRRAETPLSQAPAPVAAPPAQPEQSLQSPGTGQPLQRRAETPLSQAPAPVAEPAVLPLRKRPPVQVQRAPDGTAAPVTRPAARINADAGSVARDAAGTAARAGGPAEHIQRAMPAADLPQRAAPLPAAGGAAASGTGPLRPPLVPAELPTLQRQAAAPLQPVAGSNTDQDPADQSRSAAGASARASTAAVQRVVVPAGRQVRRKASAAPAPPVQPPPAVPATPLQPAPAEQARLQRAATGQIAPASPAEAPGAVDAAQVFATLPAQHTTPLAAPVPTIAAPAMAGTSQLQLQPAPTDVPSGGNVSAGQESPVVQLQRRPATTTPSASGTPPLVPLQHTSGASTLNQPTPATPDAPSAAAPYAADAIREEMPVLQPQPGTVAGAAAAQSADPAVAHDAHQAAEIMRQPDATATAVATVQPVVRARPLDLALRQPTTHDPASSAGRPLVQVQPPSTIARQTAAAAAAPTPAQLVARSAAERAPLLAAHPALPTPVMASTAAPAALQRSPAATGSAQIINRAVTSTGSAASNTPTSAGSPDTTSAAPAAVRTAAPASDIDLERVTDQVYQRLLRRLSSEREQRGW